MTKSRRVLASAATACALLLSASPVLASSSAQTFTPDGWFQVGSNSIPGNVWNTSPVIPQSPSTGGWGTTPVVYWSGGGSGSSAGSTGGTQTPSVPSSGGTSTAGWSWATGPSTGGGSTSSSSGQSASGGSSGGSGNTSGSTGGSQTPSVPPSGGSGSTGGSSQTQPSPSPGASGSGAQIEAWTNATRAQHGMPPLADNALLDHIATVKCQDMITNNYFGHISPTYGSPYQMQQAFGVHARTMGAENIAGARDASLAYFMLVNSPEHLANILYNGLTDQGAAVVPYGIYGVYVCQEFIGN